MTFILKTNSAYSYLWPIINDLTKNFNELNVLVDNLNGFEFNKNIKIHYYNIDDKYPIRLRKYLNTIDSDYVFLIHDVDLILNFNFKLFEKYFQLVKNNNIDRLSLGLFNGNDVIDSSEIKICKLHPKTSINFQTPYDHSPSLYKKSFLMDLYSRYSDHTYASIEMDGGVQNFIYNSFSCYGIKKTQHTKPVYHRGFVYSEDFNFLHITVKGKFLKEEYYFDLANDLIDIKTKYKLTDLGIGIDTWPISKNQL